MADEELVTLQTGAPWPQTYVMHDGVHYTRDEAGFLYVRDRHVAECCNKKNRCKRYTVPPAAKKESAAPA